MLRPFQLTDHAAVNRLLASVGWPTRSQAGWAWLATSPAGCEIHAPQGWIEESDSGDVVGFLGNLVLPFDFRGRRLRGATGFSIVVRPEARGAGRRLIDAFLKQDGVFTHYTLNANALSAPIYARHGMTPWPQATSGLKLSWIADPVACMSSRFLRAAARLEPQRIVFPERLLTSRLDTPAPLRLPQGVDVVSTFEPNGDYALYWSRLSEEGRLRVDRGPAEIRWRFADPDLWRQPLVLGLRRDRGLTSVAIAVLAKGHPLEPAVLEVIDLTALSDEKDGCEILLRALIDNAPRLGAAKTRLPVVSPWLLDRLGETARIARHEGGWGHCHARFGAAGPDPELWSPTAWDGDYSICLRPAPISARPSQAA